MSKRTVQTQRQRFHHLLLDVNQRLATVAATIVLLQVELDALRVVLARPMSVRRARRQRRPERRRDGARRMRRANSNEAIER